MPKNIRYVCKRRRNQLIKISLNNELLKKKGDCNRYSDSLQSLELNTASNNNVEEAEEANILTKYDALYENCLEYEHEYNDELLSEQLQFCANNDDEYNESQSNISIFTDICSNENSLPEDLQNLIIERKISYNTANQLLHILRKHGHVELPVDVRFLVNTPRNAVANIQCIGDGHYIHFGLSFVLERSIKMYSKFIKTNEIKLHVNVDGFPISKSSDSQFWPIMASIEGIDTDTLPFLIGVYHGLCKPSNANDFLTNFVNDYISLKQHGITVNNKKYAVIINAILCDASARAFITCTKNHTGYFSCPKCIQEGDLIDYNLTFPKIHNTLRTDELFKEQTQMEHHTGNSILEQLSIEMVSQIPLDYMHLVCLGVVKHLLQLWVKGKKNVRLLLSKNVSSVSQELIAIKRCIPVEFSQKPRSLHDIDNWNATEFRQFLLYSGMVVMKSRLSPIHYNHFLSLCIAIRIMADPQLCTFNAYANSLLQWFVFNYGAIYGDKYITNNVHNLLHLASDAQNYGCLDNFSCFKYENYMQKIKEKLHQCEKPLQELLNRVYKELQSPIVQCNIKQYPIAIYMKNTISYVQYKNFRIAINEVDNCALLEDNSVAFILDIFQEECKLFCRVRRFFNPKSFFTTPCASEKLGIFLISNTTTSRVTTIAMTKIKRKCLKVKYTQEVESHVIIPLLHTNN